MKAKEHTHENLHRLADVLYENTKNRDLKSIRTAAKILYEELFHHIRSEESPEGWLADVEKAEPRLLATLKDMRDQHYELLSSLEQLAKLDVIGKKALEEAVGHIDQFRTLFRRHDQDEEKILREVFYSDLTGH